MERASAHPVAARVAELRAGGSDALAAVPDARELAATAEPARRELIEQVRLELYALTAILADAIVGRAERSRKGFRPYGLARSRFSEWGMLRAFPEAYEAGSIRSFFGLWQAFVDTVVLHLHRELRAQHRSEGQWVVHRVRELLALLAAAEGQQQARKRDVQSFVYGGLQFGTSVCVQLVEVFARVLAATGQLDAAGKAAVMTRSVGPAYHLAGMNFDVALPTYSSWLSTSRDTPAEGRDRPGWLDARRFVLRERQGAPAMITLREDDAGAGRGAGIEPTYPTLGCPARVSPDGGTAPITVLWRWCVQVAHDAGLLDGPRGEGPESG